MRLSLGKTVVFLSTILSLALLTGCSLGTAEMEKTDIDVLSEKSSKSWEQAETTPLGKYPELVTYTLGQMKGANNSNLPDGQTYEDNAYTRYLKKTLNIQNKNVFMESEERYDEALNILVKDRNLPDIFLVSDRETLEELVENDLIEDLTEVYKSCASDKIKEMYESYGEELLASGTFDGKLYALPETAIDDGPQLLWLRRDWMEQLGLKEPKTLEEAFSVIRAFQENRMGAEDADEMNTYFALNVDPTARPLMINVDYNEATYIVTKHIREVLYSPGDEKTREDLSAIEAFYFDACKEYLEAEVPSVEAWAAYKSRISAVGLLVDANYRAPEKKYLGDGDGEIPQTLRLLEKNAFIQIIMGRMPVSSFDSFVEDWYRKGGDSLTERVREGLVDS